VFSATLSETGGLNFTIPVEVLRELGISLTEKGCVLIEYKGAAVEAPTKTDAYDVLRDHIRSLTALQTDSKVPLRTCNERSWDWSRADVLWTHEHQLAQFTPEEIADPASILTTLAAQYAPNQPPQDSIRVAQKRRRKLVRILGMREFVLAHPNLDIKCRDEMQPAGRLITNCGENHSGGVQRHGQASNASGVSITYLTTTNRIHLKDLASELEAFIAPTDVHAFDVFMMGVASVAAAPHPPAEVVITAAEEEEEEGELQQVSDEDIPL
jgi:hypothetical protein